jgi:hypothetical protein
MGVARPTRKDPRRRPHTGAIPWLDLEGRDPNRHYVGVKAQREGQDEDTLVAEYEARGYRIEKAGQGGLKFKFNHQTPVGKPLQRQGHVIMSIGADEKAVLDEFGENGNTGMELAREIEALIYDNGGRGQGKSVARESGVTEGRPSAYQYLGVESDAGRR